MKASIGRLARMGILAAVGMWWWPAAVQAQSGRHLFHYVGRGGDRSDDAACARLMQRPTTRRAGIARIDTGVFDEEQVVLNLFSDVRLEANQTRIGFSGARYRTWFGTLAGSRGTAVFIINGDRISGKINADLGTFEIFPLERGGCVVVEHDSGAFPGCGMDGLAPSQHLRTSDPAIVTPPIDTADTVTTMPAEEGLLEDGAAGDTPVNNRIRVLVAYTSSARSKTQATLGRTMQEHIDLAIAESNQGYANSGVTLRIELACMYQTGFVETPAIENDVEDFRNDGDGKGDEVHQFRTDYDADMCCLITDGRDYSWCGWSYGFDYTSRDNMFQATAYACATGNFSFAHEFGHTQGCRHNDDDALTPFAYGHGYRNGSNWRTVMALANYTSAPRLNYWSNPDIDSPVYPFTAMGTPVDGGQFANDCRTALNVGGNTVVNHETTPSSSTAPTGDSFQEDEFADKVVTDELTVGTFTANPGSRVLFRAGSSILLQPGFQAQAGSDFHARLSNPLGDSPPLGAVLPASFVGQNEASVDLPFLQP